MKVTQLSGLRGGLSAFPCGDSKTFVMHEGDTIASPCSSSFLGKFQGMQRAINAYVKRFGIGDTIAVDGDLGPATLREAQLVWEHGLSNGQSGWPASKPVGVLQLAGLDVYTAAFSRAAGAPVDNSADAASGPEFIVGEGVVSPLPSSGSVAKAGMGGAFMLALAAGWFAYKITGKGEE